MEEDDFEEVGSGSESEEDSEEEGDVKLDEPSKKALQSMGLPFLRPEDYYAEMVKSDSHMERQSGFAGGDKGSELDLAFEDGKPFERSSKKRPFVAPGDRSGGKARQGGKPAGKKPKKREIKDSKFGYGGRKGSKKQNVAETTNDLRGFNKDSLTSGNRKRKR
ncbi:rRNA-processing protein EBP2-like protein [Pyrus ussuriensis x Pyrus communis]|uniref:rRNA-processing protein EBP2-like protein n=1 Tax=Pyrus ussuriensis x Pyrus communis TaxID=2448454 RepID=A0A5N5F678_9ROSA|nr:rRNA-processing protein EBP2-like protein [Pyrus ussuriensis x Pyrus communis]